MGVMIDTIRSYIENKIELAKLELVSIGANIAAGMVSSMLILVFVLFILLMLNFSLAFWLGDILENNAIGFAIMGGFYVVLFIIYLGVSGKKIENKIKDIVVKAALSNEDDIEND